MNTNNPNNPNNTNNTNDDIIYHMDPAGVILKNPDLAGKVKQALILCLTCDKWKNLTYENNKTLPQGSDFRYNIQRYRGYCLTDECIEEKEENARQKRKDIAFWAAVRAQNARCDEADRRCDAFFKNAMKEQEERNAKK